MAGGQSPGFCSQRACARLPFNRTVRFSAERSPPSLRRCGLRDVSTKETALTFTCPQPVAQLALGLRECLQAAPPSLPTPALGVPVPVHTWVHLWGQRDNTTLHLEGSGNPDGARSPHSQSLSSSGISPRWVPGFWGAAEQREQWPQILLHGLHDLREPLHSVFFPSQGRAL